MKKLLLAVLTLTSISAFAQRPVAITFTSPAAGSKIENGAPVNYVFYIKNTDVAAFASTDTIGFALGQLQGSTINLITQPTILTHNQINAGDSVQFTQTITLNIPAGSDFDGSLCVVAFTSKPDGTAAAVSNSCRVFNLYNTLNEVQLAASNVKIYPNPAQEAVNFFVDSKIAKTISIMDITGKQLETVNVLSDDTKIILNEYNNGIYLYQIKAENGEIVKAGKFNVSR